MNIYNDNPQLNTTCEPSFNSNTGIFNFEGHWEYYLEDLRKWLGRKPTKMYLDLGRGYYVLPKDVEEELDKLLDPGNFLDEEMADALI